MAVERHMTAKVITVGPDTSVWKAWKLLQTHQIRHLPVIQGRRLVGMITDRSLRQLMPSSLAPPDEQERFRAWGAQSLLCTNKDAFVDADSLFET